MPSPMLFGEHQRIVELAAKNRLPGMYQAREFVDAGGLISYGADQPRYPDCLLLAQSGHGRPVSAATHKPIR
jgi:hypothetical protein